MPRRKGKKGKRPIISSRAGMDLPDFIDRARQRIKAPGTYKATIDYLVEDRRERGVFTGRASRERIAHKAPGVSALQKLRDLQKSMGQRALARAMGVNARSIRKWVNGRRDKSRREMSQKSLAALNRVLVQRKRKPLPILTPADSFVSSLMSTVRWAVMKKTGRSPIVIMGVHHVEKSPSGRSRSR